MKYLVTWFIVSWSYHHLTIPGYRDEFGLWHKATNADYCQKDSTAMFKVFHNADSAFAFYNRASIKETDDSMRLWGSFPEEYRDRNICFYWNMSNQERVIQHVQIDSVR